VPARDDRPFYALGAVLSLVGIAFLVPATRAWLLSAVVAPLRAQAEYQGGALGYTLPSLLVWAIVGGVFAWAAYELVFVRARIEPDRAFFLALAPALLLGPLLHAALVARLLPRGSVLAYMAAEPLVYLTIALFAGIGLALGRLTRRPILAPLAWGALAVALVLWILAPEFSGRGIGRAAILLALAVGSALVVALAYRQLRPGEAFAPAFAVIGAHALDGATTWMVLRDPFGLGFQDFGERNPVSQLLVDLGNGWPYFALKLALPVVLLSMVKREETEERLRAFLLFAVFVLGFGPGMANLIQVMTG
jgi:uncharacterized membrane protein